MQENELKASGDMPHAALEIEASACIRNREIDRFIALMKDTRYTERARIGALGGSMRALCLADLAKILSQKDGIPGTILTIAERTIDNRMKEHIKLETEAAKARDGEFQKPAGGFVRAIRFVGSRLRRMGPDAIAHRPEKRN
jgi:hypothetical protein